MTIQVFRYGLLILGFCLMTMVVKGDAVETPLYTIEQEKTNRAQAETIAHHQQIIGARRTELRSTVDTLTERLQTLEQQKAVPALNGQRP